MKEPPIRQKIICPVCHNEILPGEPVCWVCYGGPPTNPNFTANNGVARANSGRSPAAKIVGGVLGGIAISLASVGIGVVITLVTIIAMIEAFFQSLGCAGTAALIFGWIAWAIFSLV